jgi:hypothetical protein
VVHRPDHAGEREAVPVGPRLAIEVADARAVPHVPEELVRLVGRSRGSPPLRDLQELVDPEGEALEVGHHLAVVDERRRRPVPHHLPRARRIRIDEQARR